MNTQLLTSNIRTESDVVFVRQRARQIAALLGFDAHEQTRIATAVSEIARNAFLYAVAGQAQFSIDGAAPEHFVIRISDRGQGIPNLPAILAGNYKSGTGMGLGLLVPGSSWTLSAPTPFPAMEQRSSSGKRCLLRRPTSLLSSSRASAPSSPSSLRRA